MFYKLQHRLVKKLYVIRQPIIAVAGQGKVSGTLQKKRTIGPPRIPPADGGGGGGGGDGWERHIGSILLNALLLTILYFLSGDGENGSVPSTRTTRSSRSH